MAVHVCKMQKTSLCDVWFVDDNPALWMRSTESNLLCFLCAPQVHFLSSTVQTRQMTEYPSPSLFLSPAEIFLFYSLSSHSTPFTKDYLSYKFGIMDHAVLEWQMVQHWRYEYIVGMSKLLQLQIFFINMSYMECTIYLHERVRVCASVSSLYVGHGIMLVTRTSGSVIVTHEFDWEVD